MKKNGKENRHAFHDVGAATSLLAIQATSLGLFIHQMAGFDVPKATELYNIPQGYEPVAAICSKAVALSPKGTRLRERYRYWIPRRIQITTRTIPTARVISTPAQVH